MIEVATRNDIVLVRQDLQATRDQIDAAIEAVRVSLDNIAMRITLRLGTMIVVAVGALAALIKLT
jgi:hypothetical protein